MRTRLLLGAIAALLASGCLAKEPARSPTVSIGLACRVELVREPELLVRVEIDARGHADGETTFAIEDDWGGTRASRAMLRDLAITADGRELDVAEAKPGRWTVHHAPDAELKCTYSIPANAMQEERDSSGHYKAIVNDRLVHLIGSTALALPDAQVGAAGAGKTELVRFEWVGFDEAHWKHACSFGTERVIEREIEVEELHAAVFLAAPDLEVHHRSIRGRDLCVAFAGSWAQARIPLVDATAKIVDTERAFFDDDTQPFYLVSVIQVGSPSPGSTSMGGTGLTDSFALFLLEGTDIDPSTEPGSRLFHLLAHEMFHDWNGYVVRLAAPEELAYWFSEGFTDFYARRLLRRAGLTDEAAFVRSWNDRLREFFANPAREATAERIRREFWTNEDVQNLPYQRGDVVALLIDSELRRRSGGHSSLDDWMRALVQAGRRGERVDTESLLADLARRTDPGFAAVVRRVVVDGNMPVLPADVLAPCFDLALEPMGTWDPGLDMAATQVDFVVHGVREGSNAWEAGLRDGMDLAAWSIFYGDCDRRMECTVREGKEKRAFSWMPRGPTIDTPRIRPSAAPRTGDCSGG